MTALKSMRHGASPAAARGFDPLTLAGRHRTFIAHVERQARNISLDNIERIAVALGVRVHELLMP
jgi:hypothetical protein